MTDKITKLLVISFVMIISGLTLLGACVLTTDMAPDVVFDDVCENNIVDLAPVLSKRGSSGSEVTSIQKKLKTWGYYTGSVDGIYGSLTEKL